MAATGVVVERQIENDKLVQSINDVLDKLDSALMLRGRNKDSLRGDYRNQLSLYKRMLTNVFIVGHIEDLEPVCDSILHKGGFKKESFVFDETEAMANNSLFKELVAIIKRIEPALYYDVINKVTTTVRSRVDYFSALDLALPIGRLAKPVDVAWFNRTNPALLMKYKSEHPTVKVLFMAEDASVKAECDFKAFKMGVVTRIEEIIGGFQRPNNKFFKPEDDTQNEVSNYFRVYLLEPLKTLANNNVIKDSASYLKELKELQKHFASQLKEKAVVEDETFTDYPKTIPKFWGAMVPSAAAHMALTNITNKTIIPLFDEIEAGVIKSQSEVQVVGASAAALG